MEYYDNLDSISKHQPFYAVESRYVLSGENTKALQNKYDNTFQKIDNSIKLFERRPELLRGNKGDPGNKGPEGSDGDKGIKGRKGSTGSKGKEDQIMINE